jgi:hypothetical protein
MGTSSNVTTQNYLKLIDNFALLRITSICGRDKQRMVTKAGPKMGNDYFCNNSEMKVKLLMCRAV